MKKFIKYILAMSKEPFIPKKAARTTTIILPDKDTTEGIYRSILPSYIINGADNDLRMLIVGIHEKANVSKNEKDFHITKRLIEETDHFVFPFIAVSLRPIIEDIKLIKPAMKFSYYIDYNYYLLPESYPFSKEYIQRVEMIEDNIRAVDQVIVTNKYLLDYIIEQIQKKYPGETFGTLFRYQRLFISPELFITDYANEAARGKIKALIIADEYQFSDVNYVLGILKAFKIKYKETFELVLLGWDGKRNEKNYMKDFPFTYFARVPYSIYFETIKHIGPNVLIIPATKSKFNDTSKNYIKYLEFAHLNIPVIAPNILPYSDLITTNENGFLCDEKGAYAFQLETMFTEPVKFEGPLGIAYATASEFNINDPANIESLKKVYFPEFE